MVIAMRTITAGSRSQGAFTYNAHAQMTYGQKLMPMFRQEDAEKAKDVPGLSGVETEAAPPAV